MVDGESAFTKDVSCTASEIFNYYMFISFIGETQSSILSTYRNLLLPPMAMSKMKTRMHMTMFKIMDQLCTNVP